MTSPIVEDTYFDHDLMYLDDTDYYHEESILNDFLLSREDRAAFLAPPAETWKDFKHDENEVFITMDASKDCQWKIAKEEIVHIRNRVMQLLGANDFDDVSLKHIVSLCVGCNSKMKKFFEEEVHFDKEKYLKFMIVYCTAAAYRLSSSQMYHQQSLIKKDELPLSEIQYNEIWKDLAEERKLSSSAQMSSSRNETPLWESLEVVVNDLLRSISISQRNGIVSLSLDDDKIWAMFTKSATGFKFNLKYTTHVKPNRKGIIAHTAVSTGLMFPLGTCLRKHWKNCLNLYS